MGHMRPMRPPASHSPHSSHRSHESHRSHLSHPIPSHPTSTAFPEARARTTSEAPLAQSPTQ